jgi:hypothetical protein
MLYPFSIQQHYNAPTVIAQVGPIRAALLMTDGLSASAALPQFTVAILWHAVIG